MSGISSEAGQWLRPVFSESEQAIRLANGEIFARGGWLVQPDRKLGQILSRRPPGLTGNQWNSGIRTQLDFVVCDPQTHLPVFAVEFTDPLQAPLDAERDERMVRAVCAAVGLTLLRVESSVLHAGSFGRRFVEYVIDAYNFMTAVPRSTDPVTEEPLSFRNIVGRLPDGRQGFVNDLGAVARMAVMDAYVDRRLVDPLVRGLHVRWQNGPAEGWAWVEVRAGQYLFERTRIWQYDFYCGVEPGRLAEDLAVAGIGERIKMLTVAEPVLHDGAYLTRELEQLRLRQEEMTTEFGYDHVSFG